MFPIDNRSIFPHTMEENGYQYSLNITFMLSKRKKLTQVCLGDVSV